MNEILLSIQAGYEGGKKGKESLGIEPRSLAWAASGLTMVRTLATQAGDLGLISSDSLPFSPHNQPGYLVTLICQAWNRIFS